MLFLMILSSEEIDKVEYIFRTYQGMVYKVCLSFLKDPSNADDATQQTFLKIMHYIDHIDDPDSKESKSYIYCTAHSTSLNLLKKQNRTITSDYDESVIQIESINRTEGFAAEIAMDFWDEISQMLSDSDKDLLMLRYGLKFTSAEIAETLDMTDSAVRQRLSRILKSLSLKGILAKKKGCKNE